MATEPKPAKKPCTVKHKCRCRPESFITLSGPMAKDFLGTVTSTTGANVTYVFHLGKV